MNPTCPLCHQNSTRQYFISEKNSCFECTVCGTVFKPPSLFPNLKQEKERYLEHNNNVEDTRYQSFVTPIVVFILEQFETEKVGLDFGAGTGPVISKLLIEKGFKVALYDPFFYPDKSCLENSYDFVICCEVIEHFHDPAKEFQLLRKLLKPEGKLICMTDLLPKKEKFQKWYYKNDPTHVIFYSQKNINWIKENFDFTQVIIDNRLIVFNV